MIANSEQLKKWEDERAVKLMVGTMKPNLRVNMKNVTWECEFQDFDDEYSVSGSFGEGEDKIRHEEVIPCFNTSEKPPADVIAAAKVIVCWKLGFALRYTVNKDAREAHKDARDIFRKSKG